MDLEQPAYPVTASQLAAKGVKTFKSHSVLTHFKVKYENLDRLALQKQNKETFLTNGSWLAREQMRNPACIQFAAVDPLPGVNAQTYFGEVHFKLHLRVSDRVDPNNPELGNLSLEP